MKQKQKKNYYREYIFKFYDEQDRISGEYTHRKIWNAFNMNKQHILLNSNKYGAEYNETDEIRFVDYTILSQKINNIGFNSNKTVNVLSTDGDRIDIGERTVKCLADLSYSSIDMLPSNYINQDDNTFILS